MRVDEFLDRLYDTPRDWWRMGPFGILRRAGGCSHQCPLDATGNPLVLHKGDLVVRAIIHAADNAPGHDPKIRAALLHACGLSDGRL